jgi:polyhydroxybutyrate depolymerase
VAIVVPFEALYLFAVRHEAPVLTLIGLAGMLLTPPFLAAFVALPAGRANPEAASAYGLTPYLATRPLATGALVAAKLRTALASTLAAWLLVLLFVAVGLAASGSWSTVIDRARRVAELLGPARAAVAGLLCLLALLVATWKQFVQGLAINLTGREGLIKSSVLVRLSSLIVLGLAVQLLRTSPSARIALWNSFDWTLAVLAFLKLCAAAWIATRLARGRLLGVGALVAAAAAWLALVLALYGVLAWLVGSLLVPHYPLVLVAILASPLARPSAVTLALSWNRHGGRAPAPPSGGIGGRRALRASLALFAVPAALASMLFISFHARNRDNGGFVSSGETRTYRLYVPERYDPGRAAPLVISLHGGALWGAAQMAVSRWNVVADERGFLVVYPSGLGGRGPRGWRADTAERSSRDVRFIAELIDTLKASYNVDPARIYADGLSNGGGLAFVLSCTLADRIAAVGAVAPALFLPWSRCQDPRPVPLIAFHGTEDRFTPYHGGSSWVAPGHTFPSIPAWTASWALRNSCQAEPVESAVTADISRRAYGGCADGADVVLYTIHGGGHTWPGGGPQPEWFLGRTSRDVEASRQAWAFFEAHPLRR